jgi:hypothetical protein
MLIRYYLICLIEYYCYSGVDCPFESTLFSNISLSKGTSRFYVYIDLNTYRIDVSEEEKRLQSQTIK